MRRISILLAALLMLGACGGAPSPAPATTTADTSRAGERHAAADVEFVRALIPHHEEGIALARAAASRAPARTLAEAIIVTQQDEIVRMTGWLREWGAAGPGAASAQAAAPGTAPAPAATSEAAKAPAAAMGSAAAATSGAAAAGSGAVAPPPGDPVRALIAHQEEAIKLAQAEQANGTNPAALAFARQVIESRAAQIEQLRGYLS
ncbi:DUF305 domain-containing protein [Actinoplanes sp. CA-142083]|uniref:DUF305 domain-containing protein n=1 Tax=Actinoplanes sp. CA-142083 TaxID=3239903 RepID=UPI003D9155AB